MEEKDRPAPEESTEQKHQRSLIAFPYMDLDSAISVATAVHSKFGDRGHLDSLADALGHAGIKSGTFQMKVSAARMFGLLDTDRMEVNLTPLGQRIVQPHLHAQARVEAFLAVPLYGKVFDEYRGKQLPPDQGLESRFKNLGVPPKQVEKARQAFKRSAEQSGMLSASKDKLILPSSASNSFTSQSGDKPEPVEQAEAPITISQYTGTGVDLSKHPAISSFLLTMPADAWTADEIDEWISHFKGVVTTVYKVKRRTNSGDGAA